MILFLTLCLFSFAIVKIFNLKKATIEVEIQEQREAVIFPLDINSATYNQLLQVPGIGPVMAQRIIEYRSTHGGFKNLHQLKEIKGIGDKKFLQFQRYFKM